MSERVLVHLDLDRIRANLSREDGEPVTEAEVREWLCAAGFQPVNDQWSVLESDLGQLQSGEVLSVEREPPCAGAG